MIQINQEKIRQLAIQIIKVCAGHKPSEIMTAITMVSSFLAQDVLDMSDPVEQEKYIATFANTLRIALNQKQDGATLQ